MSRIFRVQESNVLYHVINRGNAKQCLFFEDWDYYQFICLLKKYKEKFGIKLYHYVLMPNHIHLLLEPTLPNSLSPFMQGLTLAYAQEFNQKKKRIGHVWQGRFKNIPITNDPYFLRCGQYIELNPVRANMVSDPIDYSWSSYATYTTGIPDPVIDLSPLYLALGATLEVRKIEYRKLAEQQIKNQRNFSLIFQ